MRGLLSLIERLAPTPIEVLILGETGTGKELAARALHRLSRRTGKFVVLDCGALPAELAEAKILGHVRAAFTGAERDAPGCFEAADGGTIFLDEIGELPPDLQPKFLRVLESREVIRLGEHSPRRIDVRVVSATNRDLPRMVTEGQFRQDLYHRIASLKLEMPPLRGRPDDVRPLVESFLVLHRAETNQPMTVSDAALAWLCSRRWDGNVRELKAAVRRAAYLASGTVLDVADFSGERLVWQTDLASGGADDASLLAFPLKAGAERVLAEFQIKYCRELLARYGADLDAAAAHAGYSRRGLRDLLRRVGLGELDSGSTR